MYVTRVRPTRFSVYAVFAAAILIARTGALSAQPTVLRVDPADGATNVPTYSDIRIDFSGAIDSTSLTGSSVIVNGKPLSEIPGASVVQPEAGSAVILLRMTPNSTYQITLTTAVKDSEGQPLASAYTWRFATSSRLDEPDTPVRVFARYPRMNEFEIPTNAPITMTFTTEMEPESFVPGSVTVTRTNGGMPIVGEYKVSGRRVVFRPSRLMSPNQTYEARVSEKVRSKFGTTLGKDGSWQFTTGSGTVHGPIITDVWYESYADSAGLSLVLHAAVENLAKPNRNGRPVTINAALPADYSVAGAVVSLQGLINQQPLSTPTDASAKDMPITGGAQDTVVTAAYTHGDGAGGSTAADPVMEKVNAAVRDAVSSDGAVALHDSGDALNHGDHSKGDTVKSARLSVDKGLPTGQAFVAISIIGADRKPVSPVTIPIYIIPSSQEATSTSSGQ